MADHGRSPTRTGDRPFAVPTVCGGAAGACPGIQAWAWGPPLRRVVPPSVGRGPRVGAGSRGAVPAASPAVPAGGAARRVRRARSPSSSPSSCSWATSGPFRRAGPAGVGRRPCCPALVRARRTSEEDRMARRRPGRSPNRARPSARRAAPARRSTRWRPVSPRPTAGRSACGPTSRRRPRCGRRGAHWRPGCGRSAPWPPSRAVGGVPSPPRSSPRSAGVEVLDAHLTSAFLTAREFLPGMVERGRGVVRTMSSAAGWRPSGAPPRPRRRRRRTGLAHPAVGRRSGSERVGVNRVAPSAVAAQRLRAHMPAQKQEEVAPLHPLRRMGPPRTWPRRCCSWRPRPPRS